jgi:hypothetical protein
VDGPRSLHALTPGPNHPLPTPAAAQARAVSHALPEQHAARATELAPEASDLRQAARRAPAPTWPPGGATAWYNCVAAGGGSGLDLSDLELDAYTGSVIWAAASWAAAAAAGAFSKWPGPPGLPFGLGTGTGGAARRARPGAAEEGDKEAPQDAQAQQAQQQGMEPEECAECEPGSGLAAAAAALLGALRRTAAAA